MGPSAGAWRPGEGGHDEQRFLGMWWQSPGRVRGRVRGGAGASGLHDPLGGHPCGADGPAEPVDAGCRDPRRGPDRGPGPGFLRCSAGRRAEPGADGKDTGPAVRVPAELRDRPAAGRGWRDTALPATRAASDVAGLLPGCDRSRPAGLRDFAILTLLARLGLRSCEVAGLELDDIDWRRGELRVRGKGRGGDPLPLLNEVGEAVACYLRDGRPRAGSRKVFLTSLAPLRGMKAAAVGQVVRRACERAGRAPVGPHRLRHALATEMLRQGAALPGISQVLRHRDLATTQVYAKVDLVALHSVAEPWPGAGAER